MRGSNPQPPSEAAVDTSPLLGNSIAENLLRSRRFIRRTPPPPLRGAARLLRRASGRRMMLREPSVRVRENAAEQLEERQSGWAHSKPVIVLDLLWNLAFVGFGLTVVGLSVNEAPIVPLRLWIIGYVVQCLIHMAYVVLEYRKRREERTLGSEGSAGWESGGDAYLNSDSGSGSDGEDYGIDQRQVEDETRLALRLLANAVLLVLIWNANINFTCTVSSLPHQVITTQTVRFEGMVTVMSTTHNHHWRIIAIFLFIFYLTWCIIHLATW